MKRVLVAITIISMAVFMLLFLGGCRQGPGMAERIVEKAIEKETGTTVDSTGNQTTIKTDEGETVIGEGAELPDGFPGIVPLYLDMTIASSSKITQDGKTNFLVTATSSDAMDKVANWYRNQLGGWNINSEYTSESDGVKTTMFDASKDPYNLWLWLSDADGKTSITLSVEEQ